MNVHPDYFDQGVTRRLLRYVTDFADRRAKPVRLVSSTIKLDSFSLYNRGGQPVWLVPAHCQRRVKTMYAWGARNCELHFAQSRGLWTAPTGIVMPTFMPETG
jgi:hypothetical protein